MTKEIDIHPTRLGYEILKDHVLPSILGKHQDEILYWAGKSVARKFPVFSSDEIPDFFQEAGWGPLSFSDTRTPKDEVWLTLHEEDTTLIENRSYQLEAGFIAEQFQKLNGFLTECYGEKMLKDKQIRFIVKWDSKTKIGHT